MLGLLNDYWGRENSDPKGIADLILKLAEEAVNYSNLADEKRAELAEKWRATSRSAGLRHWQRATSKFPIGTPGCAESGSHWNWH